METPSHQQKLPVMENLNQTHWLSGHRFLLTISAWTAGVILSLWLHEYSQLDFWIQDYFFNPHRGNWMIQSSDLIPRVFFYQIPKWGVILSIIALGAWVISDRVRNQLNNHASRCRIILLFCLLITPIFLSLLRRYSGVWCPDELTRYGGTHAFRYLLSPRVGSEPLGQCFPAGHASNGFALMALYYLPRTQSARLAAGATGLCAGWIIGLYQMLCGSHFLTHTTAAMCIAGLLIVVIAKCVEKWFGQEQAINP